MYSDHSVRHQRPVVENTYDIGDIIYDIGDTTYDIGDTTYEIDDTTYDIDDTTYDIGDTTYDIGDTTYDIGDTTYDIGDTTYDINDTNVMQLYQICNFVVVLKSSLHINTYLRIHILLHPAVYVCVKNRNTLIN